MLKELLKSSKCRQHLISLFITVCSAGAAICLSWSARRTTDENQINSTLFFIIFLLLTSCTTVKCYYGIGYSLLAVLWLISEHSSLNGALTAFITMSGVAVLGYTFSRPPGNPAEKPSRETEPDTALSQRLREPSAEKSRDLPHPLSQEQGDSDPAQVDIEGMRATLLRAISHDLRTPLAGIQGNSLIYLENKNTLGEKERIYIVRDIHKDSGWLINLTENLLAVTRIQDNDLTVNKNDELVEEVVGEALQKVEKRHPGFAVQVKVPDEIIILPMDAVLIEQVIINLLENALLHSGSTKPVDMVVEEQAESVSFLVRDYGRGVPEELLKSLFPDPEHAPFCPLVPQRGAGIGLAICKTIIMAHRGTFLGRNRAPGAEFLFTVPKPRKEEQP